MPLVKNKFLTEWPSLDTKIPNIYAKYKAPKLHNFLLHKAKLRPSSKCREKTLMVNWECFFCLICMGQTNQAGSCQLLEGLVLVKPCTNYKRGTIALLLRASTGNKLQMSFLSCSIQADLQGHFHRWMLVALTLRPCHACSKPHKGHCLLLTPKWEWSRCIWDRGPPAPLHI